MWLVRTARRRCLFRLAHGVVVLIFRLGGDGLAFECIDTILVGCADMLHTLAIPSQLFIPATYFLLPMESESLPMHHCQPAITILCMIHHHRLMLPKQHCTMRVGLSLSADLRVLQAKTPSRAKACTERQQTAMVVAVEFEVVVQAGTSVISTQSVDHSSATGTA